MGFLRDKCIIFPLTNETLMQCHPFSCDDKDLDDFFLNDAGNYHRQLLGKSYCFRLEDDFSEVVF